jgi:hypothetical protein
MVTLPSLDERYAKAQRFMQNTPKQPPFGIPKIVPQPSNDKLVLLCTSYPLAGRSAGDSRTSLTVARCLPQTNQTLA